LEITLTLIGFNLVAFLLALALQKRELDPSIYHKIGSFGAAVILGVFVFDFIPHLFEDFNSLLPWNDQHHSHHHEHHHGHHHGHSFSWISLSCFLGLMIIGFALQLFLEKKSNPKSQTELNNSIFLFGLFIHSFTEVVLLYDHNHDINQSLFVGILIHKLPLAFILAYTLLKNWKYGKAALGYFIFTLSIPLGLIVHHAMVSLGEVFYVFAALITGMILHVVWHMLEMLKTKNWINWLVVVLGVIIGFALSLTHAH